MEVYTISNEPKPLKIYVIMRSKKYFHAYSFVFFQAIPVFLTLHNAAEVIICGHQKCFRKEVNDYAKG